MLVVCSRYAEYKNDVHKEQVQAYMKEDFDSRVGTDFPAKQFYELLPARIMFTYKMRSSTIGAYLFVTWRTIVMIRPRMETMQPISLKTDKAKSSSTVSFSFFEVEMKFII